MLGVVLFIAFWVIIGLGLFFIAIRGGVGGARATLQTQTPGGRRFMSVSLAVFYVAFGVAIPLVFLIGNHARASAQVGGLKLTAGEKQGRALFGEHCGVCHTLAAANAIGKVGPNLDTLRPPASLVLRTINNGCYQNATVASNPGQVCLGQGTMPANIVQGKDAFHVAEFVARVAGNE
jgi:mono/diheme cytochrome c family protein